MLRLRKCAVFKVVAKQIHSRMGDVLFYDDRYDITKRVPRACAPSYPCRLCCSFCSKVGATAYLEDYVDDTDVISASHDELLIVVLWVAITIGRLAGLQDQRHLTLPKLYRHATLLFLCGALSAALILIFESSAFVLWAGIAAYGLYNGPTVGYCYDLNNRVTAPSEMGMSVVMFGLNFGASIVPYIISWVWEATGWPQTLIVIIMLSHIIPYPLMLNAKRIADANKRKDRLAAATTGLSETRRTPSFSV